MVSRNFDKSVWVQDNWMMRGGWDGLGLGCGANENSSGCTSHCYILTFEMYLWSIINYQAFRCSFSFLWLFGSDEEISRKSKRFISKSNIWWLSDLENRCKSRRYFPLRFGAPWTFRLRLLTFIYSTLEHAVPFNVQSEDVQVRNVSLLR